MAPAHAHTHRARVHSMYRIACGTSLLVCVYSILAYYMCNCVPRIHCNISRSSAEHRMLYVLRAVRVSNTLREETLPACAGSMKRGHGCAVR